MATVITASFRLSSASPVGPTLHGSPEMGTLAAWGVRTGFEQQAIDRLDRRSNIQFNLVRLVLGKEFYQNVPLVQHGGLQGEYQRPT